jgi:SAM-dependent methyltransferase
MISLREPGLGPVKQSSLGTVHPVTDPSGFGWGARLAFHGPLSAERADRLAAELAAAGPQTVVDYGCGWGELLLRVLEAAPGAHGVGIDIHGPDIARSRDNAARRKLSGRVAFVEGSATDHASMADVVISCGAYQAFGTVPEALQALRPLVQPGGLLLFGAEIWDRAPTEQQLAAMWPGISAGDCLYLPDVVDGAVAAGFRPLRIETATRGEWEEFESGLAAGAEEWLLAHPDHPEAAHVRERLDSHLSIWLRGHRDVMGFAFLTLGVSRS